MQPPKPVPEGPLCCTLLSAGPPGRIRHPLEMPSGISTPGSDALQYPREKQHAVVQTPQVWTLATSMPGAQDFSSEASPLFGTPSETPLLGAWENEAPPQNRVTPRQNRVSPRQANPAHMHHTDVTGMASMASSGNTQSHHVRPGGKGKGRGRAKTGMHGAGGAGGMPRHVHVDSSGEQASSAQQGQTFPAGNLHLPFTMLRVVLDELANKMSVGEAWSETEMSTIEQFSSELQGLSSQAHSTKDCHHSLNGVFENAGENKETDEDEQQRRVSKVSILEDWQEELVQVFKKLDADGSGSLTSSELRRALLAAGVPLARLTKMMKQFDSDKTGEISLENWIRAVKTSDEGEMQDLVLKLSRQSQQGQLSSMLESEQPITKVLTPTGKTRISWDLCVLAVCTYIAVFLPFVLAWTDLMSTQTVDSFAMVDRCVDIVFGIDIVLNFLTAYYNKDGDLVTSRRDIARHYLATWFVFDLLSTFPFDAMNVHPATKNMQALKLLKLGKLLKIVKIMVHADMSEFSEFLEDLSTSKLAQMLSRRSAVLINMIFICHWMACGMKIVDDGWLVVNEEGSSGLIWREYLAAQYWSMTTLTTVGYGDITPSSDAEQLYTTFAMVVGGAFYGYVVGSITSMVSNSDLNATAFYDRMELIHAWLTHHKLPVPMKKRLRRYFKEYLAEKSVVSEAEIWRDLSPELQREVGEYILHDDVKANPLFDGLNIGAVVRLQSILQKVTVHAGRSISTQGEAGTAMYIVVSGSLQMLRCKENEEDVVTELGPGQSFGEEILLGFVEHYEYTVTVLEKVKLQMIVEDEFIGLFQTMPNVLDRMRQNAISLNPEWGKK